MRYLCFILILISCNSESSESTADYLIGSWEYVSEIYSCCSNCIDNYEEECDLLQGPFFADITFFENGDCHRKWSGSEEIEHFIWAYNDNTKELILLEDEGSFANKEVSFIQIDFNTNKFTSKRFAFNVLHVKEMTRK